MPTNAKVKRRLLSNLPVRVNGNIYELGSGWGTLAWPLAKKYKKHHVQAIELSFLPYFFSKWVNRCLPWKNVTFSRADFFHTSLEEASLVVCYLFPEAMRKLQPKFDAELKTGAVVVSNSFALPGWQAERVIEVNDLFKSKIYIYKKRD